MTALIALAAGLTAGFLAARYDLPGWVLHFWARVLGATWFTPAYPCWSCGRRVHLLRSRPDRAGIFGIADGGGRCLSCSGTSPRNAPQDAPGRSETARDAGLGVLGWPGVPESARRPLDQDRTDEGSAQ